MDRRREVRRFQIAGLAISGAALAAIIVLISVGTASLSLIGGLLGLTGISLSILTFVMLSRAKR